MITKYYNFTSPNFGLRPEDMAIDTIIIHYTEMKDDISALQRLCDVEAQVSSHYLINKQGKIFSLVPDHLRAWHAGPSYWHGREKVNDFSIGIELDNNGQEPYTASQMNSLVALCKELIAQYPINPFYILGHSDIASERKCDPGRLFDWKLLAKNNIGIYPNITESEIFSNSNYEIATTQAMLLEYGYKIAVTNQLDQQTLNVMRAFSEHFNQDEVSWSDRSQAILAALVKLIRK